MLHFLKTYLTFALITYSTTFAAPEFHLSTQAEVKQLGSYPLSCEDTISSIEFDPTGEIISCTTDKHYYSFRALDTKTPNPIYWRTHDIKNRFVKGLSPQGKSILYNVAQDYFLCDSSDISKEILLEGFEYDADLISFNHDQSLLAFEKDNEIVFLNTKTGKENHRWKQAQQGNPMRSICFSPDGTQLAVAREGKITIHNAENGNLTKTINTDARDNWHHTLCYSPNGNYIAGAVVWDLKNDKKVIDVSSSNFSAFSADSTLVANCGRNRISVVNLKTGKTVFEHQAEGINIHVNLLAFSPKTNRLAATINNRIKVWDTTTWKPIHTNLSHTTPVMALARSKDGQTVATAEHDGTIVIWDWKNRTIEKKFNHFNPTWGMENIEISPDGKYLVAAIRHYDSETEECMHIIDMNSTKVIASFGDHYGDITFSHDSKFCYTINSKHQICKWSIPQGKLIDTYPITVNDISLNVSNITKIATSPQQIWCSAREDSRLTKSEKGYYLYDLANKKVIRKIPYNNEYVSSYQRNEVEGFTQSHIPYTRHAASSIGNTIHLSNRTTGNSFTSRSLPISEIHDFIFNDDGETIIVAGNGGVQCLAINDLMGNQYYRPNLSSMKKEQLWDLMASKNHSIAYQVGAELLKKPEFISFLSNKITPAKEPHPATLELLKKNLKDSNHQIRVSSANMLYDLGHKFSKEDLELLKTPFRGESDHFSQLLLNHLTVKTRHNINLHSAVPHSQITFPQHTSAHWRTAQALLLLEKHKSPEAINLIKKMASGHPTSPVTKLAKKSLSRLKSD